MTGAELIAQERARQMEQEGWTAEHDAQHKDGSLALAAACYALPPKKRGHKAIIVTRPCLRSEYTTEEAVYVPRLWPRSWHPDWWKPEDKDRIRQLVVAGALIAAEIDRLQARSGEESNA